APRGRLGIPPRLSPTRRGAAFTSGSQAAGGFGARPLAAPAGIGAGTAVLMLVSVALAFVAAGVACGFAGMEHEADDFLVEAGPARRHGACRGAHVGAVEVEPDALGELLDRRLAETGVGAGGAGLRAVIAGLDAADQGVVAV